ncbi:MAG: hypothetical protein AB7G44_08380 [Bacteroidia bacterium]
MKGLIQKGLSSITSSPVVTGVEVVVKSDNEFAFNLITIERKKESLLITNKINNVTDIQKVIEALDINSPVVIVVNGKGIMHRKLQANNRQGASSISAVLPNAKEDDFYIQKFSDDFVSIIRKSVLDKIVGVFLAAKIWVCEVSVGPFSLQTLNSFISVNEGAMYAGDFKVLFVEGKISLIEAKEAIIDSTIHVGNEQLKQSELIPFAAAFGYILKDSNRPIIQIASIESTAKEFFYSKVFKATGWSVLITFFVLLLVNFVLFSVYTEKLNVAQASLTLGQQQIQEYTRLKNELSEKEKFLREAGLSGSSRTSFFADRIAMDLPHDILLEQLLINPSEKKIREGEQADFIQKVIVVKGSCDNSPVLNAWLKILKENDWVRDVEVLNYDHSGSGSKGVFELRIKVI